MKRQIDLILTNQWKATLFALGLMVAIFVLMVGTVVLLAWHPVLGVGGVVLLIIGLFMVPERLANQFSRESAVVIIDDAGLMVQLGAGAGHEQRLQFADLVSYSIGSGSGLTLRPRMGPALRLHLNPKLQPQGMEAMSALEYHFQQAVADYQRQHPDQPLIRNLGFFHSRGAVVLLLFFACLLAWLGWRAFQPFASEGAWGGFLFVGLLLAIYALVWQHNRKQMG